jgi:tRNA G18 (ribose-2'-O)-methylase SpoU
VLNGAEAVNASSHISPAGVQLDETTLHMRQKEILAQPLLGRLCIAAVGIANTENIGMIFRVADAVRCDHLLFVDSAPINVNKIKKVSRHTHVSVPHDFVSSETFLSNLCAYPPLIALEITTTSQNIFAATLPAEVTLVVGGERDGIPEHILAHCQRAVHIPMYGVNSSMNVATALGIAAYEVRRRWNAAPAPSNASTSSP